MGGKQRAHLHAGKGPGHTLEAWFIIGIPEAFGSYYCWSHPRHSELESWLGDGVGGETQSYIYTTLISVRFQNP